MYKLSCICEWLSSTTEQIAVLGHVCSLCSAKTASRGRGVRYWIQRPSQRGSTDGINGPVSVTNASFHVGWYRLWFALERYWLHQVYMRKRRHDTHEWIAPLISIQIYGRNWLAAHPTTPDNGTDEDDFEISFRYLFIISFIHVSSFRFSFNFLSHLIISALNFVLMTVTASSFFFFLIMKFFKYSFS